MFIHRPTRRFRKSVAGTTLAAAALGMAALITAGTAGAGSVDDAFIAQKRRDHAAQRGGRRDHGSERQGRQGLCSRRGAGLLPAVRHVELRRTGVLRTPPYR
jgi:hypothetical protein